MQLTAEHALWLYTLQRPWPLVERPLEALAQNLNCTEQQLVAFIENLRAKGWVRRVGAVFDARRLGYRSCLFAVRVKDSIDLERAAQRVCAQSGVTHAYTRGWPEGVILDGISVEDYADYPQLWYTLSAPQALYDRAMEPLADLNPQAFPALTRYKIDVVFDPRTHKRDERTEYRSPEAVHPLPLPTVEQQALVRRYQEDCAPLTHPFQLDDLPQLQTWQAEGTLRRFALLLRHRASGFTANGMCCWSVPEESVDTFGRRLAEEADVTHCYARPKAANFPFNLYAMIHKHSWEEGYATYRRLTDIAQLPPGRVFFSTREFKKQSLRCFLEPSFN